MLITRPEESYRLYCVVVCDLETSKMGAPYIYDISRLRVKSYGIRTVKIRNSKLVVADGGAGFILYYSASGDVLYFLFPDMYSGLNKCTRCHHSLIFVLLSALLFVQEFK